MVAKLFAILGLVLIGTCHCGFYQKLYLKHRKLFFFEFGNPKVTVLKAKGAEIIQGRKLFKGGNYMRNYIRYLS